jgi:hypothetical protein
MLRQQGPGSSAVAGSTGGSALPGSFGQAVQNQVGDFLDAVVDAAPDGSAEAQAWAADVSNQVADAIAAALKAHGCSRGGQSHLLCGALAAVARAMMAGEDLLRTAVIAGVTAALAAGEVPRPVAGLAGRAGGDALMKVTPIRHYEDVLRAAQTLAMAMCPNVAGHPEVEQYCGRPIASAAVSSAIQQELTAPLGGQ